jgi:hypothetical protein
MKAWTTYPSRFLLMAICEKPEILTKDQRDAAGICARRILEFALAQTPREDGLVRSGIEAVCRTYESDPAAAEALLRKLLPEEYLKIYGYLDMPVLAREAGRLIAHAPALVRDIYISAFNFEESRDEQTSMGSGKIMPLTSNRRQDYQMAHWQFGKIFPVFLRQAPEHAIEALVAVVSTEAGTRRTHSGAELPEETFNFQGSIARIKTDCSHIWDVTQYRHEAHLTMLDAFEAELVRVGADPSLDATFQRLISAVAKTNHWAALWRKVLTSGIRNAKVIGKQLADLAASVPILTGPDTSHLAGEFIKAAYSELDTGLREKIELAILAIPTTGPNDRIDIANRIRDRLLGCIPTELIASQKARALVTDLTQKGGVPRNEPPFQIHSSFEGPYTDEQFLADQGVPVNEAPNRKISELTAPLRKFVTDHSNKAPSATEVEGVSRQARQLYETLRSAPTSGAHQHQIDNAWTHLVGLCACVARCDQLDGNSEVGRFVKKVLLEGAGHQKPEPAQRWDEQFDDHASWSPAPRIDAAEGLLFLSCKPAFIDPELLAAIRKLSTDPVPAVRLQIADHLGALANTAPLLMNTVLKGILANDPSSSVVLGAVNNQLWPMIRQRPGEVENLALTVYKRNDLKGKVAEAVRSSCVSLFLNFHLWKDHVASGAKVREFCSDVAVYLDEAAGIVSNLREVLVVGAVEPPEPTCEAARLRAFQLLETIIASTQSAFDRFQETHKGVAFSELPQADQEQARGLVQLLDSISSQLYFASGAFDEKPNVNDPDRNPLSLHQKKRFLKEAGKALDLLGNAPHPSIVHHLIETLHGLIEADPKEVFLRIVRIVKAGKSGGYQYESLAIGEIVTIVNSVFADYRPILQADQSVRLAMVEMLDVFVEVGWPQAIQLTYRLDEVFR